jgi:hypothetical protein
VWFCLCNLVGSLTCSCPVSCVWSRSPIDYGLQCDSGLQSESGTFSSLNPDYRSLYTICAYTFVVLTSHVESQTARVDALLMKNIAITYHSSTMTGATIQISTGFNSARDRLSFTSSSELITSSGFDSTTGTLQLSGTASPEDYTTALQSIL